MGSSKDEEWRAFGGPGLSQYPSLSLGMLGDGGAASLLPSGLGLGALANSSNNSSPALTGVSAAPRFTATAATNTSPQLAAILGAGPLSSSNSTSSSASSSASAAGLLSSSSKPFVPRTQQQPVPAPLHQQLAHQQLSPSLTGSSVTSAGSMEAPFVLPQRPAMPKSLPLQQQGAPLQDDTAALCLQMASSCLLQDGAGASGKAVGGGGREPEEEDDDVVGLAMEAALDRAYLLLDEEDDAGDEEELLEDPFFFTGGGGSGGGGSGGSGSFGLGGGGGLGGGSASSLEQYDAGPAAAAAAGGSGGYMASGFYGDNGGGYGEAYGGGYGGQGPPMPGFGRQGSHHHHGGGGGGYHPHHHHGGGGYHHPGGQQMYLRDAAVSVLLEYFPQCSPRALLVALRRCEFDIEAAARCVEAALRPSVPPCRYYLAGFCARSDCQYSHDVAQMPCTYWLMGGCRDPKEGPTPEDDEPHDGSCCFLHDFPPMSAPPTPPLSALMAAAAGMGALSLPPAAAPPAASPTISPDDEEQFPALTPSKPASSSSFSSAASGAKPTAPAPAAATGQTPAKSFLQVALSTDKVKKPASSAGTATATAAGAASASGASGGGAGGPKTVGLKELVSRQKLASVWVMGGEEVRRQYQRAREEASRAAQARNRCFMQATAAFQRGDKAAAKALGEQGRNMNALMRAQHRQAALTIFASRNPSDARIYQEGIVDLHGLHVQEALEMLEELLPDIFRVSGPKEVLVITGTGRHSGAVSKHQSRLFPALDDHLREIAGAMARKQSRGTSGAVSVDAAAAALYSHVADPAGHKGGFRIKVNRRLMEYWAVEL